MKALRAVMAIPWLVCAVWIGQVAAGVVFGFFMNAGGEAALRPYSAAPDGHALYNLVELFDQDRSLLLVLIGAAAAAGIASVVFWTVASPFVLARLSGAPRREAAALAAAGLPAVAVQTCWHFLLRAALIGVVLFVAGALPATLKLALMAVALGGSAVALDAVRTQVTLHGARPFHIGSAWFAFVRTFTNPRRLAAGVGLWALQVGIATAILWLGLRGVGPGSHAWPGRALGLLGLLAGFVRLALSATDGAISLRKAPRTTAED